MPIIIRVKTITNKEILSVSLFISKKYISIQTKSNFFMFPLSSQFVHAFLLSFELKQVSDIIFFLLFFFNFLCVQNTNKIQNSVKFYDKFNEIYLINKNIKHGTLKTTTTVSTTTTTAHY